MKLAIITDSTSDLTAQELQSLQVEAVPLHVNFKGKTWKDWAEISPADIISGVKAGADLPSTSQPSPAEFADAYARAVEAGAEEILVITISSKISGTFQSANIAAEDAGVPVTVFDSLAASLGHGSMVRVASRMRGADASLEEILAAIAKIRDGDIIRVDAEAGTLAVIGDEREFLSRTPATEDLRREHHGMGRELFAGFRAMVGAADRGASVFG